MSKVAIVTDSTSSLPAEMIRGLNIQSVPLQVIWGEETYRDGLDLSTEQFYARLPEAKVMPTTSQPSPAAFRAVYETLLEFGIRHPQRAYLLKTIRNHGFCDPGSPDIP